MDNAFFDENIQRIDECIYKIKLNKFDNLVYNEFAPTFNKHQLSNALPCQTVEKHWRTPESSGQK